MPGIHWPLLQRIWIESGSGVITWIPEGLEAYGDGMDSLHVFAFDPGGLSGLTEGGSAPITFVTAAQAESLVDLGRDVFTLIPGGQEALSDPSVNEFIFVLSGQEAWSDEATSPITLVFEEAEGPPRTFGEPTPYFVARYIPGRGYGRLSR